MNLILMKFYTMNKYIKTDIENAVIQMKAAIMNALNDIDSGEEREIDLGKNISGNLLYNCLKEARWKRDSDFELNGWESDFFINWISPSGKLVLIQGSLWCGVEYKLTVQDE